VPLDALLTILGAALVTFAIRAGGLLLADRLPQTGFAAVWLKHLPGAVMASLVAPLVINGGPAEWIASAAATLGYVLTRNLLATIVIGVAAVFIARHLLGV
jgi:uncharacterized membrane protein